LCALLLAAVLWGGPTSALAQGTNPPGGYYYVVQRGDSWTGLAWRTGLTVDELKAANPSAIRPNDWLWTGERLWIPARAGGYWYTVKSGDSWQSVAQETGLSIADLWRANLGLLLPNRWLYVGQQVWIPKPTPATGPASPTPAQPGTAQATPPGALKLPTETPPGTLKLPTATPPGTLKLPTATPTITPRQPTATPPGTLKLPTETPAGTLKLPTATVMITATAAVTVTHTPQPGRPAGCPAALIDFAAAITGYLNQPGNSPNNLGSWLTGCGALRDKQGSVTEAALQTKESRDLIVTLRDPAADTLNPRSVLLIYHRGTEGYRLVRKFEATGAVELLRTSDLNADGKLDVIWTDTTCGAHTCFSTLFVESWDGKAYQDWLVGEPTMASPKYTFEDVLPGASGSEIQVYGGLIGSVGAGPQRAWAETYASVEGGPYQLVKQMYDPSPCLYHRILDANRLLADYNKIGFGPAIAAYTAAIDDRQATACGNIADELDTLRQFARFRLVTAYIASGKTSQAEALLPQITQPGLRGATDMFIKSYRMSGSVVQACRDTDRYAEGTPSAWEFLSNWGYANPTFTAQELCPFD
jgi:LysM repeat protein